MAYNRWRKENMSNLEKQQALEVLTGFKCYREKYGQISYNGKSITINPTYCKKWLQKLERIRKSLDVPNQTMTVTDVFVIQREITDILLDDLIDDVPTDDNQEKIRKNDTKENSQENISKINNKEDNHKSNIKDKTDLHDLLESDSPLPDEFMKGFFKSKGKTEKNEKNSLNDLGELTGNLMGSMLGPMLGSMINSIQPSLTALTEELNILRKDPDISEEKRQEYQLAYEYYFELSEIYRDEKDPLVQTMKTDEVNKKFNKKQFDDLIKNDPKLNKILTDNVNMENLEKQKIEMEESLNQLKDCSVS